MYAQVMARLATIAVLTSLPIIANAEGFREKSFVYIECYDSSNARVSRGSGVLIGSDGRVLTAKHVIKSNSTCRASLGTGATTPSRLLSRGRVSSQYDAMIVRLVLDPDELLYGVPYARIATLKGKSVTAYGVPVDGKGEISVRRGVISTTVPNDAGHLETDVLTARGMSGGPVILNETGALVGIVVGADLDVTNGLPTNYAVLAAQEIATELDLAELKAEGGPVKRPRADYTYQYNHEGKLYVGHFAQLEGGSWIDYGTDSRSVQMNFAYQKTEEGRIYLFDASRKLHVRFPVAGGWSEASGDGKDWGRMHFLKLESSGGDMP